MPRFLSYFSALLLFFISLVHAQPSNKQAWNTNVTIASDEIAVNCSQFLIPFDVGRDLEELDPHNEDTGEFSQTLKATLTIKMTLQPQSGTSDTLATISGCVIDGTELLVKTNDVGDTITITGTGNINPPGATVILDNVEDMLKLVLEGTTWYVMGGTGGTVSGGGCTTLDECFDGGNHIDNATPASPLKISRAGDDFLDIYIDDNGATSFDPTCNNDTCDIGFVIRSGQVARFYDNTPSTPVLTINPSAASPNLMYAFGAGYEPLVSTEVVLRPAGNCTVAESAIVTNAPLEEWATCADTTGDSLAFSYTATTKIVGDATATLTVTAVNLNATPSGTFTLQCAAQSIRPGIDAYAAHSITGQQPVSFTTFDTQNRPEQASATFTINGTVAVGAHIMGQCNVSAVPAQIANIRLKGTATLELAANSLSD